MATHGYRHVTASLLSLHPQGSGVVAQLLAKCSKLQEAPNTRFAQILGLHLLLTAWSLSLPHPCSSPTRGARYTWRPRGCAAAVPVVGVDEQVQVSGVHVIHDVLAVGVDHLHVTLHLLLHGERATRPSLALWPWPLTTLSMLQLTQGQSGDNEA